MSVVVKNMTLPKRCLDCPLFDGYNYFCNAYSYGIPERYHYDSLTRPEWCELVELPEKHGRLIDEDNVIDAIHERLQTLQTHKEFIKKRGDIDLLGVMPYIAKIQTVIEAEGEG